MRIYGLPCRLIMRVIVASAFAAAFANDVAAVEANVPTILHVSLKPQVEVRGGQVMLGDVAALSSPNLSVLRRAMALPLGMAPQVGDAVVLEAEQLNRTLRTQIGLSADQIDWQGASYSVVNTAVKEIAGETMVEIAASALRRHLEILVSDSGAAAPRIELDAVAVPSSIAIPLATTELKVRPLGGQPLHKRMMVWVDVFAGKQHVRTVPVRFEVSTFSLVPVAASAMKAGIMVDTSALPRKEVDVVGLRSRAGYLGNAETGTTTDASKKLLRQSVKAGEVVGEAQLVEKPAVSRGEWVNVTSTAGSVTLQSRAEVLQDGRVGQTIRARALNANGAMLAKVVAPGQLELTP